MKAADLRLLEARPAEAGECVWVEVPPRRCRVRPSLAALACATLALTATVLVGRPRLQRPVPEFVRVTVAPGDTLWGLARRHGGTHSYLPRVVHEMRRLNRLSVSRLAPGQELLVPVGTPTQMRWEPAPALAASRRAPH